ncbi:uncharacterized protein LY89DRAFT_429508 [Mollisia scopiformis]|uniref:Uncharacterized protein n=1 Tax=Mollisia scopiformis TaxID=149040 RepID=A0A194XM31_MOLSC|nr:uncharacterized protein LY89DRAFT_429508 [Mollisia scopiformis]KUJ21196.1 hypothetical protein LY89DRAFT_429508 [Mollisia scopiformis]
MSSRTVVFRVSPNDPTRALPWLVNGNPHLDLTRSILKETSTRSTQTWLDHAWNMFAPRPIFDIRRLPIEIRLLLFRQCLLDEYKERSTPALIQALRPDPQLYEEVLEVYYSIKLCSTPRCGERVKTIPQSVMRRATALRVWYRPEYLDERQNQHKRMQCNLFDLPLDPYPSLRGHIRSLYMATDVINHPGTSTMQVLGALVRAVIVHLPALGVLTVEIPHKECSFETATCELVPLPLPYPTFAIDYAAGVIHKWDVRPAEREAWANIAITWDAGPYQNLTWTDCDYWRSIPWKRICLLFTILTVSHKVDFWKTPRYHNIGLGCSRNASTQIWCGDSCCQKFLTMKEENLAFSPDGWPNIKPWREPDILDPRLEEARNEFMAPRYLFTRNWESGNVRSRNGAVIIP